MKKIILIPAIIGVLGVGVAIGSTSLLTGKAKEQKVLTIQEIEKKAQAVVDGKVTSVEFEKERSGDTYEVEIKTKTEEHDLKLDAYTGELLKQKSEALDADDKFDDSDDDIEKNEPTSKAVIKQEKAIEIALAKVKGTVTKVELDDGVYEIEITDNHREYELEVNATTGEIVVIEEDLED